MWDLFKQQPILLDHPAKVKVAVAAVSRCKNGEVGWWNADYLINANSTGHGGSGFPFNPTCGKEEWDEIENCWVVRASYGDVYKFRLPDERMLTLWEGYKQYVPTPEALQGMVTE